MEISLENIGKRYNREWIFRGVGHLFQSDAPTAILGSNGSGKSTLLGVVSGRITASEGSISYIHDGKTVAVEDVYRHFTMAAPYQELLEEFTLDEMLDFHCSLKPLLPGITRKEVLERLGFRNAAHKPIRYYSSGMKQRVKLALALLSDVPLVLLDEPCSNLDRQGMEWYRSLVSEFSSGRTLIVCSNHQEEEIACCGEQVNINDFKR